MIKEYILMSYRNIRKNKLRNWLTMLGIFIGIATVVSVISLGQGMQEAIKAQLNVLGPDNIIITPKGGFFGVGSSRTLTEDDLNVVKKTPGIDIAVGMTFKPVKVKRNNQVKYVNLIGLSPDEAGDFIKEVSNYQVTDGRDLKKGDVYKAVAGYFYSLDKKVFDDKLELRDKIYLNDVEFKIVGFLGKIGNPEDDANVYVSDDAFKKLYPNTGDEFGVLMSKSSAGEDPKKVAERVKKNLRESRNLEEGKEDFDVETSDTLFEIFGTILLIVQIILIGLASVSLIVGGIGIMNTMYTAVLERTREIGVMKAIGATNKTILSLFLIESGFIGLVGGGVGILIGMGFGELVAFIAKQFVGDIIGASFSPFLIIGTLGFSFIVGSVSGTFPALQASKLKPVEALRYE